MSTTNLVLLVGQTNKEIFEVQRALNTFHLHTVRRFEELCCYFGSIGIYQHRSVYPLPALILLDLLVEDAGKIISWLRTAAPESNIPIIAIGDSIQQDQVNAALEWGANAFYDKSAGFLELPQLARRLVVPQISRSTSISPYCTSKM